MTFLFANIPLHKLNNKHIKNLFYDISHSLPSETSCRKIVLQLRADKLERIRNAVHDKFLWLLIRALYLAENI